MLIGEGPSDITIEHNTVSQSGNIVMAYGGTKNDPKPIPGFVFRDNLIRHNQYGVHGADRAAGQDTLDAFFPERGLSRPMRSRAVIPRRYPRGNTFLGEQRFRCGSSWIAAAGDFRLSPAAACAAPASDWPGCRRRPRRDRAGAGTASRTASPR